MKIQSAYLSDIENKTFEEILTAITENQEHPVSCVNWKEFPYAPEVSFHVAHTDKALVVLFDVKEDHLRAVSLEDNGPVWEDSCCEFFVADPAGNGYFNFEMNCVGTLLAAKRKSQTEYEFLSESQMSEIQRFSSLPHAPVDSVENGQKYWIAEVIPFSILGLDKVPESVMANFYKCGDKCQKPHFLSMAPIDTPSPCFHCPEFFQEITFKS